MLDDDATRTRALRDHALELLAGGHAHVGFDRAVDGWPEALRGASAEGLPYTAWQLLEHLRIAQRDIVDYSRSPDHVSPPWPEGYWPPSATPPDPTAWEASVAAFRAELEAMKALMADPERDLLVPFPWSDKGHTLLREALLLADHNAYHVGQLVVLRRVLGVWSGS